MTVLYFLLTIVLLVSIHEWGHFATARFFGVGVRSFTIGFGKQFVSWVDPKTGTSWGLAPYPVGGYVGLLGEKESPEAQTQTTNQATAEPQASSPALTQASTSMTTTTAATTTATTTTTVTGKPFLSAPLHAKIAILFAGPLINLVFAAIVYATLAYTAPPQALPIVATPPTASPAANAGLQSGDTIVAINGNAVNHWRDVQTAVLHVGAGDSLLITTQANGVKTLQVPLSLALKGKQTLDEALGLRLRANGLLVQRLVDGAPAQSAGVAVGDQLIAVNGVEIEHPAVLLEALERYAGGELTIMLRRDGEALLARVKPTLDAQQHYKIGVQFAGTPKLGSASIGGLEALKDGVFTAYTASVLTVKAFGAFLSKPFSSDQLAGPVTIAQTAKSSADQGWQAALAFIAGLSISVGVLNLLPVPMLDGGQILYHFVTNAARKLGLHFKIELSKSMNTLWSSFGIAFVLLLTLLAFFADGKRLLGL
jgi:regulator of sigma E protease